MPDGYVGAVLSDLPGRRGRVTGTQPVPDCPPGNERTVVHAEVPEAELTRYAVTLRSLTGGTGRFSRAFARNEIVPASAAAALRARPPRPEAHDAPAAALSVAHEHAARFLAGLPDRPVWARATYADMLAALGGPLPDAGQDPAARRGRTG